MQRNAITDLILWVCIYGTSRGSIFPSLKEAGYAKYAKSIPIPAVVLEEMLLLSRA